MKAFLFLAVLSLTLPAWAQQAGSRFVITRNAVAGGVLSSNTTFSLGSTVGEPIPSSSNTNNHFTIRSEFWVRPAPVVFAPHTVAGGGFVLSFETEPGELYFAQFADSLDSPTWQSLSTVSGNGTIQSATNSAPGASVRFYRIGQQ